MEEKRGSIAVPAIIAAIGLLIALGIYVAGYFALCYSTSVGPNPNNVGTSNYRMYRTQAEAMIFIPAASVESLATGTETRTGWLAEP